MDEKDEKLTGTALDDELQRIVTELTQDERKILIEIIRHM